MEQALSVLTTTYGQLYGDVFAEPMLSASYLVPEQHRPLNCVLPGVAVLEGCR